MNKPQTSSKTMFGFISVDEIEGIGHCGGLLIVTHIGRPIEFHCSAPVVTNRAQKILYGETYDEYICCEQIGLSLIDKARTKPQLFLANDRRLLGLNKLMDTPIAFLETPDVDDAVNDTKQSDANQSGINLAKFEIDGQSVWCENSEASQLSLVQALARSFTKSLSLDEPFERIQKAIEEAQAVAR